MFHFFFSEIHQVKSCKMTGNQGHGLFYNSFNNEETTLQVERTRISANGYSEISRTNTGAVLVGLVNNYFSISNNYISNNQIGGVHVRLNNMRCEGGDKPGLIYGNTFESTSKETVWLESPTRQLASSVTVSENILLHNQGVYQRNFAYSVFKNSEVMCNILENLFYNNSGRFIFDYHYSDKNRTQQKLKETPYI